MVYIRDVSVKGYLYIGILGGIYWYILGIVHLRVVSYRHTQRDVMVCIMGGSTMGYMM